MDNVAQGIDLGKFSDIQVRAFVIGGVTWYVASDIGLALGYASPKDAISRHCKNAQFVTSLTHSDEIAQWNIGNRTKLITKPDVLRLISNSHLPNAQEIEKWIFEDVVPTVIDTGMYVKNDIFTSLEQIELLQKSLEANKVLILENKFLKEENKSLEQDNQVKEAKILQYMPMVEKYKQFMDSDGLFSFGVAAKIFYNINPKVGRNRLFKLLAGSRYIFRSCVGEHEFWEPYQDKMKYFKVKSTIIRRSNGSYEYPQIFITPKGLEHMANKFFQ